MNLRLSDLEFDEIMETASRNGAFWKLFRGNKEEKKAIQAELAVLAEKGVLTESKHEKMNSYLVYLRGKNQRLP